MARRWCSERRRFRQLRLTSCLYIRRSAEAACRRVFVVARISVGSLQHRGDDGGGLFAAARLRPRPRQTDAYNRGLPRRIWWRIRVAVDSVVSPVSSLLDFLRPGCGRERHGADGLLARGLELVRETARYGTRGRDVRWCGWRDGVAASCRSADSGGRVAASVPDARRDGDRGWRSDRGPFHPGTPARSWRGGCPRRRLGPRRRDIPRLLDSHHRPVRAVDCPERIVDAHGRAAERPWRVGEWRGARAVGDGHGESARPAHVWVAARPVLRAAGGLLSVVDCRARHVLTG